MPAQVTDSVVYIPVLEFHVVWNVRPRFPVKLQRYLQTTPVGKVRRRGQIRDKETSSLLRVLPGEGNIRSPSLLLGRW